MKYKDFSTLEDFVCDEYFKDWVRFPNRESDLFWTDFLFNHPGMIPLIEQAKELLLLIEFDDVSSLDPTEKEIEGIRLRILANKKDQTNKLRRSKLPSKTGFRRWQIYATAACVLLILLVGSWSLFKSIDSSTPTEWIVKETQKGQIRNLILTDGSKIKLSRESRLEFPNTFDDNERLVRLVGEAFFEITEDKSRPFHVLTTNSETTVIGTSFNIQAYPSQNTTIAVFSGNVEIEDRGNATDKNIQLAPNQKVTIYEDNGRFLKSSFDPDKEFGWSKGVLFLDGVSLEVLIHELEGWYGVEIKVVGKANNQHRKIHGRFKNSSLEYVLKALVYYANIKKYQINGTQVILYI